MAIDTTFAAAHRIGLDATSWVEHVPGWLTGSDQLLAALVAKVDWGQRDRWMVNRMVVEPRLTAEYPQLVEAPEPMLRTAATALSEHYGVPYDGLWINFYRNHRDSTGWHGDWPTCKQEICTVPVLSLGATRRFLLKPRQGGRSIALTPGGGDLVVMGGRCQRDWRHCIPKQTAPADARVSVNFSSRVQAIQEPSERATQRKRGSGLPS